MDSIFQNADSEKMGRIINAAIKEFSLYPYEKASTNNIVKNAGISKGLLFHYFGNKQELYDELIRFVLNKLVDDITSQIDWNIDDILERIKQLVIVKIKIGQTYPRMFDFILKVVSQIKEKNIDGIMSFYEKYGVDVNSLLGDVYTRNIDFSKFRDQENITKSMNIIRWTLEKYAEEELVKIESMDNESFEEIADNIDAYISILKKAFY